MKTLLSLFTLLLISGPLLAEPASSPAAPITTTYLLSPFDQVSISVYDEPDLESEQRISDSGTISIPLLGELQIGKMTVSQAQKKIEQAFIQERYIVRPVVTINVKEFAPKLITVTGEVEKPGTIRIPTGMNSLPIEMAIAESGGFTGAAQKNAVKITRKQGSKNVQMEVNVPRLQEASDQDSTKNAFLLYPSDIVVVPRRLF